MTKKTRNVLIICIAVVFVVTVGIISYMYPYQPMNKVFAELDASQVESVQIVYGIYEATLSEEDTAVLVDKLNKVELVGRGTDEFIEYVGCDPYRFYIQLKDGTEFLFSPSNPFYIIDGEKGYRSDYRICNDMSRTYHAWVEKYIK